VRAGGITLLRKRIAYLKNTDLPSLDKSREAWEPHKQAFKDKLAELDRMELLVEELVKERVEKRESKQAGFFKIPSS